MRLELIVYMIDGHSDKYVDMPKAVRIDRHKPIDEEHDE